MEKKFIRYDEQYTRLKLLYKNTFKKKQTSLKILILHGFGSTAESCKEQITPLFDSLNEIVLLFSVTMFNLYINLFVTLSIFLICLPIVTTI